ncbi:hypothetical protein BN14_02378 [Rhizoctonia solani AG-1 IB]|uniref:Uncharacterized protein n=1 Tax=Thanatephorus cucumeris (strain AG1-IB / isolate 7/3/14) TaxID=1108050 RepID=M5BLM3_THACB|nr:hypothetical protein BN14_02378 [Rhizoctonia solani AG-1 IB]
MTLAPPRRILILPDTPDHQRRVFTELPPLAIALPPPSTVRASLDTPSKPKAAFVPPRLSLDTPIHRVSPIRLPSFSGLSTTLGPISPSVLSEPTSPTLPTSPSLDESTIIAKMGMHSPSPTIISATTMSTIQESLLGDYGISTSSSESDHDQTFPPGEDGYAHRPNSISSTDSKKQVNGSDRAPPRLTVTSSGRTSPLEPPSRDEPTNSWLAIPELPECTHYTSAQVSGEPRSGQSGQKPSIPVPIVAFSITISPEAPTAQGSAGISTAAQNNSQSFQYAHSTHR